MNELLRAQKEHYSEWDMDLRETRLKIVAKMILAEDPGEMLDIACSSGKFSSMFLKAGWDVAGIDVSDNVIYAKEGGLNIIKADVSLGLPYKSGSFVFMA